jgi:hypothetical protein
VTGIKHGHGRWKHLATPTPLIRISCIPVRILDSGEVLWTSATASPVIPTEAEGSWLDLSTGMVVGNISPLPRPSFASLASRRVLRDEAVCLRRGESLFSSVHFPFYAFLGTDSFRLFGRFLRLAL